jgi:hypothetical protein
VSCGCNQCTGNCCGSEDCRGVSIGRLRLLPIMVFAELLVQSFLVDRTVVPVASCKPAELTCISANSKLLLGACSVQKQGRIDTRIRKYVRRSRCNSPTRACAALGCPAEPPALSPGSFCQRRVPETHLTKSGRGGRALKVETFPGPDQAESVLRPSRSATGSYDLHSGGGVILSPGPLGRIELMFVRLELYMDAGRAFDLSAVAGVLDE